MGFHVSAFYCSGCSVTQSQVQRKKQGDVYFDRVKKQQFMGCVLEEHR